MAAGDLALLAEFAGRRDVPTSEVLVELVRLYNAITGAALDPSALAPDDASGLRLWAIESGWRESGYGFTLPLHLDMASKLSRISQARCPVCPSVDGNDVPFAPETFPIGVPPWSHQAAPNVGAAFRQAVQAHEVYRKRYAAPVAGEAAVCLRLVFVLEDGAAMKDCDNMAKGLLDAFQGMLYANDRQVEHLDLVKIHKAANSPGYILVRLWPTRLNDHSDVLTPMHPKLMWMDHDTLDVASFLPKP